MNIRQWTFGDRVVLRQRPEWGTGVITQTQTAEHEGDPCQRLTVRFERAGIKTLSTAIAELAEAAENREMETRTSNGGWLAELEGGGAEARMIELPDSVRDPFRTLGARLEETIGLFRFDASARSLLDWAAAQSGLKDPLAQFNRHELEELFRRFSMNRAEHLRSLAQELKRTDPNLLTQLASRMPSDARQVLRRADIVR